MSRRLDNATARRLLLHLYGLSTPPRRRIDAGGLEALIERIGFVQVDSIATVARAHQMILFARNDTYRPALLTRLLERDRTLFEGWTHDASLIPTRLYPYWRTRMVREKPRIVARWRQWQRAPFEAQVAHVLAHVESRGPTMARDLAPDVPRGGQGWWDWHPGKTALEFLWRTGSLAVTGRVNFQKVYDLTERVLPSSALKEEVEDAALTDWACRSAFERMGFATPAEIAGFWDCIDAKDAAAWCTGRDGLLPCEVEGAQGDRARRFLMSEALADRLGDLPEPPARLRVLSPFDPLIRDRRRLAHVFGFDYRIEVFVPEAQRRYGYYVFPLLEGARLIGRIDMKRDGKAGILRVARLWLEPKVRWSGGREAALESELARIARFAGCDAVHVAPGALEADGIA
ncbi:MAG: YcaQ family DNA glycosylase [Geminicoccaceae bacterium]|nr:YcaQ family DNA glycosylase [Geminicoccaceae bacterium]